MRKAVLFGAIVALAAATVSAPAVSAADPEFKFHGEITTRQEYLENFTDFNDDDTAEDNIDFGFYRVRFGAGVDIGDGITGHIELQNFGDWGNSFPAAANPGDPILGGVVQTTDLGDNSDVDLYQAWVEWKAIGDSPVSIKLGRQEHTLGNELHLGDNDFYGGQYFDGLRATFDFERWDLDAFYYVIQERSVPPGSLLVTDDPNAPFPVANDGSDDRNLGGFTANIGIADGHNLEPYALFYRNGNEGDPLYAATNTFTLGVLYGRSMDHESAMDWSIEAAAQTGDVNSNPAFVCPSGGDDCDLSSMAAEGWFGYTFGDEEASHHRIHLGFLMLGDGDDAEDLEAFQALAPDTHGRAGLADVFTSLSTAGGGGGFNDTFTNFTDINVGWQWWGGNSTFGVEAIQFSCTEDAAGSTCPTADEDDLGQEVDLWYQYNHGEHLGMQVGVASFMPGDTFDDPITGDSADDALRVWGQVKFRM